VVRRNRGQNGTFSISALTSSGAEAGMSGDCFAARLKSLRKNSIVPSILGGAALQRCDDPLIFNPGFSR